VAASVLGRQFGHPRGLLGRLVGRFMARGNASFNTWVVQALREGLDQGVVARVAEPGPGPGVGLDEPDQGAVARVAELGPGPGVGLARLLGAFPDAKVWGVDQSSTMLGQARSGGTRLPWGRGGCI
jgi:hypothetical protein